MSAQAVLSMIAPAPPATPQGSSGVDPAEFGDLLASLPQQGGSPAPSPRAAGPRDGLSTDVEAEPAADGGAEAAAALPIPLSPATAAPAPAEPDVQEAAAASTSGLTSSAPPPVRPDAAQGEPVDPVQLQSPRPAADAASTPAPANDVGDPVAAGPKGAAAPPETARAALPPAAQLRPLADRLSKPLDDADAGSTGPAEPVDGKARPPATPSAATAAPSDPAPKPVAAAAPASPPAAGADRTVDAPPPAEGGSAPADAAAPVREHQPPALSRPALDATVQIAAQIARKLEGRSTRFEIALRPDELGRVDVKLDIDSEGRLAARLAFDNPAAATDLRGRADELRRQLENAGFQLADDAFEFAERDSGSSAFDRGQDARGQNRAFRASARLNAEIDVAQPPRWLALSLSPSGVDMKV